MTHSENGTGNGNDAEGIIHAEGVFFGGRGGSAISSTPQACGLVFHHPRRRRASGIGGEGLPGLGNAFELVAKILEVIRADAQVEHFLDHRQKISQRTNRAQRWGIGGPHQAAGRRQHECVFDHAHGDAALVELRGQHRSARRTVPIVPGVLRYASRTWRIYSSWPRRPWACPQPCGSRSDGPSMCTVWQ